MPTLFLIGSYRYEYLYCYSPSFFDSAMGCRCTLCYWDDVFPIAAGAFPPFVTASRHCRHGKEPTAQGGNWRIRKLHRQAFRKPVRF
jgi:hypothetical protein